MIRFVDLFAGIGGMRLGLELAARYYGIATQCILTSEIKPAAIAILQQNHPSEEVVGDIRSVCPEQLPDFDILLAGFPCQAFSVAGKRDGFLDTRGTLFFEVERILLERRPRYFLLENVEGLITHDRIDPKQTIGRTFATMLEHLTQLGYYVQWRCLNARDFGVPQERRRVYIVGSREKRLDLSFFETSHKILADILERNKPISTSPFIDKLLDTYSIEDLYGKSFKDKRGGTANIHSWDLELKGEVSQVQKKLLNSIFKERRKKKWAQEFGIKWMDGMPLTQEQIATFFPHRDLGAMLEDLVCKGYLKKEYPKQEIVETKNGLVRRYRLQDATLPLGYNIVTGKLSFEVSKVLDPRGFAPTLVATDMSKLYVVDGKGIRPLTLREGLRLFGYPDEFRFDIPLTQGYDLLGNTVAVPVIEALSRQIIEALL